ncbi:putative Acetyl-CoA synthetase-like protein [Seiridium cardinale]|uniref:Acetyl-CoA synthetase-like protein n=1 Tax=Seiridium cardinale TaxID=138064 RepID=A0ABR2XRG5_9PEZI
MRTEAGLWRHISSSATSRSRCLRRGFATSKLDPSGLSYAEGPKEPPLLRQTVPEHFASIVSKHGDRPAVIARSPTVTDLLPSTSAARTASKPETKILTYDALDTLSNTLADSLRSLGVKKGDRVAVSLGNVVENAALSYAIFKLGAILVPLNPTFNQQQLIASLAHLSVEVLIIGAVTDLAYKPCRGRSNLPLLEAFLPNLRGKVESPKVPSLKTVVVLDNSPSHPEIRFQLEDFRALTPFSVLLDGSSRPLTPDSPLVADETINIQFTSGTTSVPKAAMLSHTNILNNGYLIGKRMGLVPEDKIIVPPPLFHCFGCVLGYMAIATTGSAILFPSPAFDPAASLHMVGEQKATGLYGVATMFVAELELLANPAFSSKIPKGAFSGLKKGIAAGSSVPESLMRKLFKTVGLQDLVICYGQTETSPVSIMTAPNDPFEKRTGSVGRAMPHTAVKVVDPRDRTKVLPIGEKGELASSGYLIMKGYYNDAARTAEDRIEDEDGRVWMYSGDEARMDEDGFVEITGRIKDLIIRGGENIHPLEVENCVFECPGVQEVSVVGVHDDKYGEAVAAFVVPSKGWHVSDNEASSGAEGKAHILRKEDIRQWVKKGLSSHLVPKYIWWIDDYPKTASGKIQKFKLRELAATLLKGS